MEKTHCRGILGYIFGHKFSGRYSREDITSPKIADAAAGAVKQLIVQDATVIYMEEQIEAIMDGFRGMNSTKNTYVHDICTRCGHTIQKP